MIHKYFENTIFEKKKDCFSRKSIILPRNIGEESTIYIAWLKKKKKKFVFKVKKEFVGFLVGQLIVSKKIGFKIHIKKKKKKKK